jgi:hypothetical protein
LDVVSGGELAEVSDAGAACDEPAATVSESARETESVPEFPRASPGAWGPLPMAPWSLLASGWMVEVLELASAPAWYSALSRSSRSQSAARASV